MNGMMFGIFGVAAVAIAGRLLLKYPLVALGSLGAIGYTNPQLPWNPVEQLRVATETTLPAVDTASCSDESAADCIRAENSRYATQILQLHAAMLALQDMIPMLSTGAMEREDLQWEPDI